MPPSRPRALWYLPLLAAVALSVPTSAHAFENLFWHDASFPIVVKLEDNPLPDASVPELEQALVAAIDTWNAVPCARITMIYEGLTTDLAADDVVIVRFVRPPDIWSPDGQIPESATGATGLPAEIDPNDPTPRALTFSVRLNAIRYDWQVGAIDGDQRTLDPQAVMTHELGHVLTLGHTGCSEGGCEGLESNANTMAPRHRADLGGRTLAFADKALLCDKYWQPGSECGLDTACNAGTCEPWPSPVDDAVADLCNEPIGDLGEACGVYENGLLCRDKCLFTVSDRSEGFCSDPCDVDADCPDDWACLDVSSVIGEQAFYCFDMTEPEPEPPDDDCDEDCSVSGGMAAGNGSPWLLVAAGLSLSVAARRRRP